jgi:hypothetical protein
MTEQIRVTVQDKTNDINHKRKSIHDLHSIRSRSNQATHSASISSSRARAHYQKKTIKSFFVIPILKSILLAIEKPVLQFLSLVLRESKRAA